MIIATITKIEGNIFIKQLDGTIQKLSVGDTIESGEVVFGADEASAYSVEYAGNGEVMTFSGVALQLYDPTMIPAGSDGAEGAVESASANPFAQSILSSEELAALLGEEGESGNVLEETSSGKEAPVESELQGDTFAQRTGAITDVNSGLRNAKFFGVSHDFEQKGIFGREDPGQIDPPAGGGGEIIPPVGRPPEPPVTIPLPPQPPVNPPPLRGSLTLSGDTEVPEGQTASYTLTLSEPPKTTLSIILQITHATTEEGDLEARFITVSIPAGQTSITFAISNGIDAIYEGNEEYVVSIVSASGGEYNELIISDETVTTTITDGQPKPTLTIDDQSINEQEGTMTFTVSLSGPTERDVTFEYATENETSTAGADYTAVSGTKTIPAGSTSITITVPIHDDYLADNGETFRILLSNPSESAVIGDGVGVGSIFDDTTVDPYDNPGSIESDTPDTITIRLFALDGSGNRVSANDVAEGSNPSYIVVAFDKNGNELDISGTVQVSFGGGTATGDGTDYASAIQTVTLGETFTTTTTDDYLSDNNEMFTLAIMDETFSDAASYESIDIDTSAVSTTIKDNTNPLAPGGETGGYGPEDTVYVQLITNDTVSEGGTLSHTVKLVDSHGTAITVATGETITVNITYANGTGLNGDEYTASTPIVILGGTSFTTFDNPTHIDTSIESIESYTATIGTVTQANGTYEKVAPYTISNGADGDVISVSGTIIDGVDAVDDAATVVEGSHTIDHTTSGNLLDNDERGAAGTISAFTYKDETGTTQTGTIGTEVDTQYGRLTLNANGTWTYISDPTETHGTIIDTITYTLTDGSHSSQADFDITVTDTTPTAVADTNAIMEEVASVSGNVFGASGATSGDYVDTIGADTTATPVSGVARGSSSETTDLTNANTVGAGHSVNGDYGSVVINADGTYTYTLDNTNLSIQDLTTNEHLTDTFSYTIKDSDGDISTTTLTITIDGADDGVTLTIPDNDVSGSGDEVVYEAGLSDGSSPSNSDIVNSSFTLKALDGLKEIVVNGTTISAATLESASSTTPLAAIDTNEGLLVINGYAMATDGTIAVNYTYTLKDNQAHPSANGNNDITDSISIVVNDTDTGTTTSSLDIRIVDDIPNAVLNTNSVIEDVAVNGSGNLVASGTVVGNDTIGADTTSSSVTGVRIAGSDTTTAAVGEVASAVLGTYGSVNIAADGAYTYTVSNTDVRIQHLKAGESLTDTFVYTITDSDGDSSTTTLTITINGTTDAPTINAVDGNSGDPHTGGQATVYEAGLDTTGSNPSASSETTTGTISVSAKDGLTSVSIGATVITEAALLTSGSSTITINTGKGLLVIDGFTPTDATHQDGSGTINYTYTLTATQAHATALGNNEVTDAIALIVTSRNTATATGTLSVTIVDDVPTAVVEMTASLSEGGGSNIVTSTGADAVHYNLLTNDTLGADGVSVTSITYRNEADTLDVTVAVPAGATGVTVDTVNGSLTVKADGSWSFTSDLSVINTLGADATDTFTYVITDGDGDTSSATKTFSIADGANPDFTPLGQSISEVSLGSGATLSAYTVSNTLGIIPGSDAYTAKFSTAQSSLSDLGITSGGVVLTYTITDGLITAKAGALTVFTATLTNVSASNAGYDFKLYAPIDHVISSGHDTSWILPFDVYIQDSDGDLSATKTFNVDVTDSFPSASAVSLNINEDEATPATRTLRISQDAFSDGTTAGSIVLNNGVDGDQTIAIGGYINVYDADNNDIIGRLYNPLGDGTLRFDPYAHYSDYASDSSVVYKVYDTDGDYATQTITLSVTPVADAPTWAAHSGVTTNEDTMVALALVMPTIVDNSDQNNATAGDHGQRLGYITLTSVDTGAKIYKEDGTTLLFTGDNNTMSIVIVDGSGNLDTTVHYSDLTLDAGYASAIKLTQAEFAALQILPPPNKHNDIDMTLSVMGYEVDDDGDKIGSASTAATGGVHVEVSAVTDPITLSFDNTMTLGDITTDAHTDDTFTYTATANEGIAAINLQSLMSPTSGNSVDLDGSEQRSYTVSGIPEGTIVNLGGTTATSNASGIATVNFSNASELLNDPSFTMTFPEQYSGTVNATIILSVYDQDADTTSINAGLLASPLTQTLYFNIVVAPVADITTLAITQAQGDEDTPIALAIRPTSVDSSETFTITIADIPSGSEMKYDGVILDSSSGSVTIAAFDSTKTLTIKPPLNSNEDFNLQVTAHSVDAGQTGASSSTLALSVDVIGVADSVTISTSTAGTNEATIDNAGHKVALTTALVSTGLTDTDGSETLSVILTHLASEFSVEGAAFIGGSGLERKWAFPSGDLGSVFITTPANYSGTIDLQAYVVTTENDGNSLKGSAIDLTIPVIPSTETTVNLSTALEEDTLANVSFAIAHQNGDTDETLDAVWIKVSDVTGKDFTLYYGNNHTDALSGTAQSGVVLDGGYYKLTGDAISNIYVQNSADKNGSYTFNIKTIISDISSDNTTGTTTTTSADTIYTLTVAAVTDPITIAATVTDTTDIEVAGNVVTLLGTRTTIDVPLTISQVDNSTENGGTPNGEDIDGSETLLRLMIDGVPDGVSVVGGTYIGDTDTNANTGCWFVEINQNFNAVSLTPTVQLLVDGSAVQLNAITNKIITITAYSQDDGAGVLSAVTTIILNTESEIFDDTSYTPGTPVDVSIASAFDPQAVTMSEDTASTLNTLITTDVTTAGTFSITLSEVPAGTIITGMTSTTVAGQTFYYATGTSLSDLLSSVTVQAPQDSNNNVVSNLTFKATVTSTSTGGTESVQTLNISAPVTPVSDATTISITAGGVTEDNEQAIVITISNPADTSRTTIIDGKLYLSVDDGAIMNGVLKQGVTSLSTESITGIMGVPDGAYYVINGVDYNSILNLTYTPASNASGSVALHVYVNSQESNAANVMTSDVSESFTVTPVSDGVNTGVSITASGNEDTQIPLVLSTTLLADLDGSERIYSATLSNIPDGYLVYVDSTTLAINAGSDGTGHNIWSIPLSSGALPSISILPPPNVSGTISGIRLTLYSGESASSAIAQYEDFNLVIHPISDAVTIYPTQTFGSQYTTGVTLNLNASARDLDGSETATIVLVAALGSSTLSADAWFMIGSNTVEAEYSAGTWTLRDVSAVDLGNIMIYHPTYTGTVDVSVQMQDGTAVASAADSGSFAMTVSSTTTIDTTVLGVHDDRVVASSANETISTGDGNDTINAISGNDTINAGAGDDIITVNIASGDVINGGSGMDTLLFSNTGSINLSGIATITNIEKIDLSGNGNQTLTGLSMDQIFNMSDSSTQSRTLTLDGDSGDVLAAVDKTGWLESSQALNGSYTDHIYTKTGGYTLTLKVETVITETASGL